ncbi:MAG: hypothetical protein IT442_16915, partial [Phycisphaeraceae bacterium]|nr:hypothetical protein [Phycisphaeraceae bacterium]
MRRWLTTALRLGVAAGGLAYIAMTLTWQDQVVTTASGAQEFRPGVLSTLRGA